MGDRHSHSPADSALYCLACARIRLRAFHTLLRPGGWLAIADLDQEDGSFHSAGFDGHNGFDRAALGKQMMEAGFSELHFSTGYVMKKATSQGLREYPIFLAVATRR